VNKLPLTKEVVALKLLLPEKVHMRTVMNPGWWNTSHDFDWEHATQSLRRQVCAKEGGPTAANESPCLPPFDEFEPAYRFGYGARIEFETNCGDWDMSQVDLAKEWRSMYPTRLDEWEQDRIAIMVGWNFAGKEFDSEFDIQQEMGRYQKNGMVEGKLERSRDLPMAAVDINQKPKWQKQHARRHHAGGLFVAALILDRNSQVRVHKTMVD
jgi:hypothetical protein